MRTKQETIEGNKYFVGSESFALFCVICLLMYHLAAINLHRKQSINRQIAGGKIFALGYYLDVRHISVLVMLSDILSSSFAIAVVSSSHTTHLQCLSGIAVEICFGIAGKYFGYFFIILRAGFDDSYFTLTKVRISYAVVFFCAIYLVVWTIIGANTKSPYIASFVDGVCSYGAEDVAGTIFIAQYVLLDFIFSIYFYIQFIKPLKPVVEKAKNKDQDRIVRLITKVKTWTTVMVIVTPVSWILVFICNTSNNSFTINLTPFFPVIDAVIHAFCIAMQFQRDNLRVFRYMLSFICPCMISNEESFILEEQTIAQKEEETRHEQTVTVTGTAAAEVISLSSGLFRGITSGSSKNNVKPNDVKQNGLKPNDVNPNDVNPNDAIGNKSRSPSGDSAAPFFNGNINQRAASESLIQVNIHGQNTTQNT